MPVAPPSSVNVAGACWMKKGFLSVGHLPTLFASFFYFDMSFMVWVMLGPLGVQISKDLDLYPAKKGLMVAVPVLSGAALRIVAGVMVDRLQPKLAGIILQAIVIASLLTAWLVGVQSFEAILALGLALGVAGASFAVALPLASQWYPPEYQGRRSASPARAIPARCSRPCLRPRSPWISAGTMCSAWPRSPSPSRSPCSCGWRATARRRPRRKGTPI